LPRNACWLKQVTFDSDIKQLGLRTFPSLAHRNFLRRHNPADLAAGIVQIARENGLRGTDDYTRWFKTLLHSMRAEIAFRRGVAIGIDIQSVVRAGLHASLAT